MAEGSFLRGGQADNLRRIWKSGGHGSTNVDFIIDAMVQQRPSEMGACICVRGCCSTVSSLARPCLLCRSAWQPSVAPPHALRTLPCPSTHTRARALPPAGVLAAAAPQFGEIDIDSSLVVNQVALKEGSSDTVTTLANGEGCRLRTA